MFSGPVADHRLAHAALIEHGAAVADRPEFVTRQFPGLASYNYGPMWRLFRRNLVAAIAPARLRLFAPARESVLAELKDKLRRRQEDGAGTIMDTFQYAMYRLHVAMCFGELLDEGAVRDIAAALRDLMLYSGTKLSVFAFLPAVTTRLFGGRTQVLQGMQRRIMDTYYRPMIDARRERKKLLGAAHKDTTLSHAYVDALLEVRINDDSGRELSDDEMVSLCTEFVAAGADTTASVLEWIMAELVKNPAIQDKLYGEISGIITSSERRDLVSDKDVQNMPFLWAVVLEGLRRHPPAHQLVAHAAAEDTELGGYVIPKGTTVNFMVADMSMDERTWDQPKEFVPKRFLAGGAGEGVDMTGTREIKMMPFGAGRRICPGMGVATLHLECFVANLVAAFEWREAEGEEVNVVSENADLSVAMEKPLRALLVPRGAFRLSE